MSYAKLHQFLTSSLFMITVRTETDTQMDSARNNTLLGRVVTNDLTVVGIQRYIGLLVQEVCVMNETRQDKTVNMSCPCGRCGQAITPCSSRRLTLSPPIPLTLYTLPYRFNPPFLIFDIRALWRSGLSARAPECQKLKMVG